MEKECSHGVEWDIPCLDCELVSLNETIFHSGKALTAAKARKEVVLIMQAEQVKLLSGAAEGSM